MTAARIAVLTGANGFVGSHVAQALANAGWTVRAGVRNPVSYTVPHAAIVPFQCDLPDRLDASAFEGAEIVIHAAYVTRAASAAEARRVNIDGTMAILNAAREKRIQRFLFVSSCSAHAGALSLYGQSKFELESRFDLSRDLVVRPGLVLGNGGLFARMSETLKRSRIVPLFDGGRQPLQTIHVDDLAVAFARLIETGATGRVILAEPQSIEMRDFMRLLAETARAQPRFVSVPIAPALLATRIVEKLGVRLPITSENLLGLRGMIFQESASDMARHGLRLRNVRESLHDLSD